MGDTTRVRRLDTLAHVAAAAWAAVDEEGVLEAISAGCARLGLHAHLAIADDAGAFLVVRRIVLPHAAIAQLERILGGSVLGRRIAIDLATPYQSVFRDGVAQRMEAPLLWIRLAVPTLGQDEAIAVAELIEMSAVALTPVTAGGAALGVLTVWGPELVGADLSIAQMLGRIAGGALAAQRRQG